MPRLRALINTANDGLRLGRCLEMLCPCDEIVIVDLGSADEALRVARQYGATILTAAPAISAEAYRRLVAPVLRDGWILCLHPRESLSESLAASLFEWKTAGAAVGHAARSVFIREETVAGWIDYPVPQTRLVPEDWTLWSGLLPSQDSSAIPLDGPLLRFAFP